MSAPDHFHPRGRWSRVRLGLAVLVVSGVLTTGTACAGGSPNGTTSPQVSPGDAGGAASVAATVPGRVAPGVSLASLGFLHGPQGFTVPTGLDVLDSVDQSNVVTLVVPADQGQALLSHLEASLPVSGYTITARSADSLIFGAPGWQGAFTMSDSAAGLTLRHLDQPTP